MRIEANRIGFLLVAIAVAGCGGSITGTGPMAGQSGGTGQGGQGGATTTIPCSAMGACECMANDRCAPRHEACWCPSECDPQIACVCGGGRFLACEDNATIASCTTELAAVQAKCANQAFVQYIGDLCSLSSVTPTCVAACLANLKTTGSCSEIDCYFCKACDCAPPPPSTFRECLAACPLPE
jgi:hypothetical protein